MYSARLLDHFQNPRNVGGLPAPAVEVRVENPVCGDILELAARVEDGRIVAVRYKARGCTASIAAGSALTELLEGAAVDALPAVGGAAVEAALDGLPNESKHAALLAEDAARALQAKLGGFPHSEKP